MTRVIFLGTVVKYNKINYIFFDQRKLMKIVLSNTFPFLYKVNIYMGQCFCEKKNGVVYDKCKNDWFYVSKM